MRRKVFRYIEKTYTVCIKKINLIINIFNNPLKSLVDGMCECEDLYSANEDSTACIGCSGQGSRVDTNQCICEDENFPILTDGVCSEVKLYSKIEIMASRSSIRPYSRCNTAILTFLLL